MATRMAASGIRPLRLAVEGYVHCPHGGLVRVERCADCDLMQGTLVGDRTEVLCAYPDPVPAVHRRREPEATARRAAEPARGSATMSSSSLVFDCDWPEE